MDDSSIDRLFSGDLDRLIEMPKRLVRLFISSTFTDMTLERNSLMERVYPRLKKYCREKHGLDFQVVDMRWGVRDEATDDHQTSTLCSREIDNCQRMSLGPNFVALLGDKYGFRPLCNRIKSTEYRALRRCLIELDINTDFLDTWYKEDLNAVPAEYLLQPISSILKNFTNKAEPELQAVDQRIWQAIQERLHELLMIGSNQLVKQNRMSQEEQLIKYSISVTEREVIEGCLDVQEAKSRCLVFVRSIQDLQVHLSKCLSSLSFAASQQQGSNGVGGGSSPQRLDSTSTNYSGGADSPTHSDQQQRRDSQARRASLKIGDDSISLTTSLAQTSTERRIEKTRKMIGKYIDLISKENVWRVDEEAQSALANLKDFKLERKLKLNGRNLIKFKVLWNESDGISLKSDEHKQYLNEMTEQFLNNTTRMIRKASKQQQELQQLKSGLVGEILQHSHYAKHVSKTFHGRNDELDKIKEYILNSITIFQSSSSSSSSSSSTRSSPESVGSGCGSLPKTSEGLSQISAVESSSSDNLPMFIYGVVGSGKTSIMAKAATLAKDWYVQARSQATCLTASELDNWNYKPCIIMRFCCTTPSSSCMVGVLTSVCRQLQYNFYQYGPLNGQQNNPTTSSLTSNGATGVDLKEEAVKKNSLLPPQTVMMNQIVQGSRQNGGAASSNIEKQQLPFEPIPEDYVRLVFTFRQLLENCQHELHKNRLFVIFLDSVERLNSPIESGIESKYSWLTSILRLPPNVRLIISCSSEQTSNSPSADYFHLKRHFLKIFFNEDNNTSLSNLIDEDIASGGNASKLDDNPNETPQTQFTQNQPIELNLAPAHEKIEERYQYLKRILIPAVRFKRALSKYEGIGELSHSLPMAPLSTPAQSRWSLTTRKLEKSNALAKSTLNLTGAATSSDLQPGRGTRKSLKNIWILHIRPLGVKLALGVLERWLAQMGRNLTSQQWSIVEASFKHCSRPIFIKLALGEVINWKSYSTQTDSKGLTFGSSSFFNEDGRETGLDYKSILTGNSKLDDHLLKLMAESETGQKMTGSCFDNQISTMEQEWLNFLDYKQRKKQLEAMMSADQQDSSGNASSSKQETSVVIRVGAITSGGQNGSGKASNSLSSSICRLSSTIEDAICQLFARIELQHGYILTKHSLSYISAARNGICENELEDILSLDDVVLDDVFQYHLPPVRRIPPLLWTRIRNDLPDYLTERDADGIVINWHHGQFKQVVQKRYLSDLKQLCYIHSLLADYFLGKWAEKAKPFRCTKQQIQLAADQLESAVQQSIRDSQVFSSGANPRASVSAGSGRLYGGGGGGSTSGETRMASFSVRSRLRSSDQHDARLQWMQAKADRRVPLQPLYYLDKNRALSSPKGGKGSRVRNSSTYQGNSELGDGVQSKSVGWEQSAGSSKRRYNMRKLTELPFHLLRAGRFLDFAQHILFNYKWLSSALAATGLQSLLADFNEAIQVLEETLGKRKKVSVQENPHQHHQTALADQEGISLADDLDEDTLRSMIRQLNILNNTIRLSCSSIHSDTQMLAPQLIGRLLPLVRSVNYNDQTLKLNSKPSTQNNKYLSQLLDQCDKDGCSDNALLPINHCLQSPDGLQLSSLEGHSFAIMSMAMAADQRHLLAISNRFIMWDISTGEISRHVDPILKGSIMRQLKMGTKNEYAVAYTSDNVVIVLDILSQRVSKFYGLAQTNKFADSQNQNQNQLVGLELIDKLGATSFLLWSRSKWFVMRLFKRESEKGSDLASSNELGIELWYSVDLISQFGGLLSTDESSLEIIRVQQAGSSLTFVEVFSTDSNTVQLLTFQSDFRPEGLSLELWTHKIIGSTISLHSDNLSQLLYTDSKGDIYLCRRRQRSWSKPKLVSLNSRDIQSSASFVDQLSSMRIDDKGFPEDTWIQLDAKVVMPLAIELSSQLSQSSRNQAAALSPEIDGSNFSQEGYASLARFERCIDGPRNHEIAIDNSVFKLNREIARQSTSRSQSTGRTLPLNERRDPSTAIHFARIYLSNRIIVLNLSNYNSTDSYLVKRLALPKDVRNISIEPNKCQLSSILMWHKQNSGQGRGGGGGGGGDSLSNDNGELFLVAASGRRILIYNVDRESFLRSIDAHQARIVQLLPVVEQQQQQQQQQQSISTSDKNESITDQRPQKGQQLVFASGSMDKTVKIWNLLNVDKDVHSLDRMSTSIESISINQQLPLAACLARGELGLWDWRTSKLITKVSHFHLMNTMEPSSVSFAPKDELELNNLTKKNTQTSNRAEENEGKIVQTRFSANGRYLLLATLDSIALLTIFGDQQRASTSSPASSRQNLERTDKISLKLNFRRHLFQTPANQGLVRKLAFFHQDSRSLTIVECTSDETQTKNKDFPETSSGLAEEQGRGLSNNPAIKLDQKLMLICHSIPDGRLVYSINCSTSLLGSGPSGFSGIGGGASSAGRRRSSASLEGFSNARISAPNKQVKCRLPVLTRDQLHIVVVESLSTDFDVRNSSTSGAGEATPSSNLMRSRSSGSLAWRTPLGLSVYSARDGLLLRSINLAQLETYSPAAPGSVSSSGQPDPEMVGGRQAKQTAAGSLILRSNGNIIGKDKLSSEMMMMSSSSIADKSQPISDQPPNTNTNKPQQQQRQISIGGEQFSKLKAVSYRERQSVVALLEQDKGLSFLIDVKTKQLLASSTSWNGKISSDSRYGLSRMFTSAVGAGPAGRGRGPLNGKNLDSSELAGSRPPAGGASATSGGSTSNTNNDGANFSISGLQLLEMRHFSPVKSLLTNETLSKLSSSSSSSSLSAGSLFHSIRQQQQQPSKDETDYMQRSNNSTSQQQNLSSFGAKIASGAANYNNNNIAPGNDTDVSCGFTRPNDAYVYYYDSRLNRLLLIRLRDGQLVANYKLSSLVSGKIKCSPDGLALILALADGSLTSLAIVDPQKNDTLLRLAKYPSRASAIRESSTTTSPASYSSSSSSSSSSKPASGKLPGQRSPQPIGGVSD